MGRSCLAVRSGSSPAAQLRSRRNCFSAIDMLSADPAVFSVMVYWFMVGGTADSIPASVRDPANRLVDSILGLS